MKRPLEQIIQKSVKIINTLINLPLIAFFKVADSRLSKFLGEFFGCGPSYKKQKASNDDI